LITLYLWIDDTEEVVLNGFTEATAWYPLPPHHREFIMTDPVGLIDVQHLAREDQERLYAEALATIVGAEMLRFDVGREGNMKYGRTPLIRVILTGSLETFTSRVGFNLPMMMRTPSGQLVTRNHPSWVEASIVIWAPSGAAYAFRAETDPEEFGFFRHLELRLRERVLSYLLQFSSVDTWTRTRF
jgi:hypothetical protein